MASSLGLKRPTVIDFGLTVPDARFLCEAELVETFLVKGVFLTCLFPLIWLLVYAFCGVIAQRDEALDSARTQIEQSNPGVARSSTEVDDARRGS